QRKAFEGGARKNIAELLGDYAFAGEYVRDAVRKNPGSKYGAIEARAWVQADFLLAHDLSTYDPSIFLAVANEPKMRASQNPPFYYAAVLVEAEHGDWPALIAEADRAKASDLSDWDQATLPYTLGPFLAEAHAQLGRFAEAEAVLAGIPAVSYDG